ncbi:MAG: DUF502 domain-containing protein [Endomicrobium sp.]|jgi:uncharacterized membrane protein|nr:DUF502 domain-containing protein [Endomicrobium sp.]
MENEKQTKETLEKKVGILVRKYLITGLIIIIPLWLTFFVMAIIFKWVSDFTFTIVNYFVADKYWAHLIVRISSFFISIISLIILGFLANMVFGKSVLRSMENLINKLPILGTVYSATRQFVNFIFGKDSSKNFKKVVFVPYPNKEIYSVAFLSGEQMVKGKKYFCVFMPTTPNPTSGFLMLLKEEEIIFTDYTVEQAFQFIISVGVIGMDKNSLNIKLKKEIDKIMENNDEL